MKSTKIFIVAIFCSAAVGLTVCLSPDRQDAEASVKPDQITWEGQKDFRWPEGKRAAISLSFDDGHPTQIDCAIPILDKYGVKGTFYVLKSRVEKRLAGWQKAVANGHEIGNHSLNHPCSGNYHSPGPRRKMALENYTLEMMQHDLDGARAAIERLLGVRPTTFAYPCGQKFVGRGKDIKSYVPLVAERFIVGRGWLDERPNDPAFCDLAQVMGMRCDSLDFEEVKNLVDWVAAEGRWLVLVSHRVGEPAPGLTTDASILEKLCEYVQDPANGLWIDTIEAVGKYILEQRAKNLGQN